MPEPTPRHARLLAVALWLSLAPPLAHAAPTALDGCDVGPDDFPAQKTLNQAEHDLTSGDIDAVRKLIASARQQAAAEPFLLLWAGSIAARMPAATDREGAAAIYREAQAAAKKIAEPQVSHLYEGAALIRLGQKAAGKKLVDEVRARPGALKAYACRFLVPAFAMADAGEVPAALALMRSVRAVAPASRSVENAVVDLAFRGGNRKDIDESLDAALAQFPTAREFVVRKANELKIAGKRGEARKLVEARLVAGDYDVALLGEFLGLVSGDITARDQLDKYTQLSKDHPESPVYPMVVGISYHYLHDYARSNEWLGKTGALATSEPRIGMYMAMNYFHLGKQKEAEQYVDTAVRAGRADPDIFYCRAVIEVRSDPAASMRDLQRYMALTAGHADVEKSKQERVQQTVDLLAACLKKPDPKACVETDVVQQAKALAFREHFAGEGQAAGAKPGQTPAAATKNQPRR